MQVAVSRGGRKNKNKSALLYAAIAGAAGVAGSFSTARAASFTWDAGGGDNNWTTGTNWVGDAAPSSGQTLVFNVLGIAKPAPINDNVAGWTVNGFSFSSGNSQSYAISGANSISLAGNITNNSFVGHTIALNMDMGAAGRTVTLKGTGSDFGLSGNLSNSVTGTTIGFTLASGTANQAPVLALSGTNTYGGQTKITGGVLRLDSVGALSASSGLQFGSGTNTYAILGLTAASGDFTRPLATTNAYTVSAGAVGFNAPNSITNEHAVGFAAYGADRTVTIKNGANTAVANLDMGIASSLGVGQLVLGWDDSDAMVDFVNPIIITGTDREIGARGNALVDGRLSGVISGGNSAHFVKVGAGTLETTAANTYTGPTDVNVGQLLINGNNIGTGVVTVSSGAILGGTGSIAGAVSVLSGGTLAPGASIESLASGALSLATDSHLAVELNSGVAKSVGADVVNVTGALSLTGTVKLDLSQLDAGTFDNATTFTLVSYSGGLTGGGLFSVDNGASTLADGASFVFGGATWTIDYDATTDGQNFTGDFVAGNRVNITTGAVPEPTSAAGLLVGGALLALRRRNRRSQVQA